MKVLLVGFGSIGERHFEILKRYEKISAVDIVSKQPLDIATRFETLQEVPSLDAYDYFVIASETVKHHEQLKYICAHVKHKQILVEKPLFDKSYPDLGCENSVFVAYNLRFHPVIQKLKSLLKDEEVYYANVICGQYLPTWRPTQDYRKSYSAHSHLGGGVVRDLSHELDYICWLFGKTQKIESICTKISDLEINTDDIFTAIAVTEGRTIVNLTMDYISKVPMRRMVIHTKELTIEADLIKETLSLHDKNSTTQTITLPQADKNHTYEQMHRALLEGSHDVICSYTEGKQIVEVIDNIDFNEL